MSIGFGQFNKPRRKRNRTIHFSMHDFADLLKVSRRTLTRYIGIGKVPDFRHMTLREIVDYFVNIKHQEIIQQVKVLQQHLDIIQERLGVNDGSQDSA